MDNSFVLNHLPRSLAFNDVLNCLRQLDEAPPAPELARILAAKARHPQRVWEAVDAASRKAERTLRLLVRSTVRAVDYWSIHYPQALRMIAEPPWVLYFVGELPARVPTLAVVGTRKPNEYGRELTATIIPQIKIRPMQLVSGLAYGIDSLAHFHACEAAIPNFAILGCGLDIVYPPEHAGLAQRIVESHGGLLSEYAPGVEPLACHFPRRNRIISGLSSAVWVVQGTAKSGTVHTVGHALDQARSVLATPGDVFSTLAELPNKLLYDGATMVLSADDIDLELHRQAASLTE